MASKLTISPPKPLKNADEIDSPGDSSSVESDSQANQRNQTVVLQLLQRFNNDIEAKCSFIGTNEETNVSSSDRAIVFWTLPRFPGVACEDIFLYHG